MINNIYTFGFINLLSITVTEILIGIAILSVACGSIVLFFSSRIKKIKEEIDDIKLKRDEIQELFTNAEQLNKHLVQENILEKEENEMLIAKMSYEIHNCVNGIIGMTNLLKDTNLDEGQVKYTTAIINCSKKLLESAHGNFDTEPEAQNKKISPSGNSLKDETGWNRISKEFVKNFPFSILIAEDEAINQQLMIKLLGKLGYTADIARNGNEALDMVSEKDYDIIFMDVFMPEMDGFEATKMIRLCLDVQPTIIAVTASAMAGDKDKCLEAGMDDYISKPIVIEDLAALLAKWSQERTAVLH